MQRSITGDVYLGQKIKIGSVHGRIVKGAASPVENARTLGELFNNRLEEYRKYRSGEYDRTNLMAKISTGDLSVISKLYNPGLTPANFSKLQEYVKLHSEDDISGMTAIDISILVQNVMKESKEASGASSPAKENFGDSPLRGQSPLNPGGIDFRSIPATLQPIGNFGNLKFIAPDIRTLQKMNLDREAQALEGMLEKGILPSAQRVKEFIYACSYKKELGSRTEQLVSLLTDMCRLQEECVCESEPELRESLMIIEAAA
jgi:hypothetical protein